MEIEKLLCGKFYDESHNTGCCVYTEYKSLNTICSRQEKQQNATNFTMNSSVLPCSASFCCLKSITMKVHNFFTGFFTQHSGQHKAEI